MKCRFYVRYVDDFILLALTREQLERWLAAIIQFLAQRLRLKLNPAATRLDSIFNGVDFAGFIIRPHYLLCRRRVINNLKRHLRQAQNELVQKNDQKIVRKYDIDQLEKLFARLNSYLGLFRQAQTHNAVQKIFRQYDFVNHYFYRQRGKIIRKYRPGKHVQSLKSQIVYFNRVFPKAACLIQIGCYYEAYGRSAIMLHRALNYQLKPNWRNFTYACGFHQRLLERVCQKLAEKKVNYVVIRQTGNYLQRTMERLPSVQVEFS